MNIFNIFVNIYIVELIKMTVVLMFFLFCFKVFKNWSAKNKIQKGAEIKNKVKFFEKINAVKTLAIFALGGCITTWGVTAGYFTFYYYHDEYSIYYSIASFFFLVILQDAYFYWTHRLLHTKFFFKYFHYVHHQSVTPRVLTSYNFSILEAFILYGIAPLYMIFLPVNIVTLQLFLLYTVVKDAQAHSGVEFFPKWWVNSPLDVLTTTTHHDLHHQKSNSNYGLHSTFWDRIMKTENQDYKREFNNVKGQKNV
jgi:lathosterol oxidase